MGAHQRGTGGAVDQGRQERHQVDAPVMLLVRRQRSASSVACAGLQSRQRHQGRQRSRWDGKGPIVFRIAEPIDVARYKSALSEAARRGKHTEGDLFVAFF